jgi:hypothetical protein
LATLGALAGEQGAQPDGFAQLGACFPGFVSKLFQFGHGDPFLRMIVSRLGECVLHYAIPE